MKVLSADGLTKLIQLCKSTFIKNTDTEVVSELSIDNAPTSGSTNLVTSGGVYSDLSNKQETLVSGNNIKTINGESVLGNGNLTVTADTSDKQPKLSTLTQEDTLSDTYELPISNTQKTTFQKFREWLNGFFVDLTSSQTISGIKTFTSEPIINLPSGLGGRYATISSTFALGDSGDLYCGVRAIDKNNVECSTITGVTTENYTTCVMISRQPIAGSDLTTQLELVYPKSGDPYTICPSPSETTDNSTKIATTVWCRSATGTFSGARKWTETQTFSQKPILNCDLDARYISRISNFTSGETPSTTCYGGCKIQDKNGVEIGYLTLAESSFGTAWVGLGVHKQSDNSLQTALTLYYTEDGTTYATCPTPSSATDNSTKIATTNWVRTATGTFSGAKTWSGTQTFTSEPIINLPSGLGGRLQAKSSTFALGDSGNLYCGVRAIDKNGVECSTITGHTTADYTTCIMLSRQPIAGSDLTARLELVYPKSGEPYAYCPTPSSATDNSTKIATTNWVRNSLSTTGGALGTFSKAQNGYLKLNNGIIIQWGSGTTINNDNTVTITLSTPFSNTNYVVNWLDQENGILSGSGTRAVKNKTTSSFTAYNGQDCVMNVGYIAIGY